MRLRHLLFTGFSFFVLMFLLSGVSMAATPETASGEPSAWSLLLAASVIDLFVVGVAIWIREGMRRDQLARDERHRAATKRLDKLDELVARTREGYATKEEMRHLEGAIRGQLTDTRQLLESRVDKLEANLGGRMGALEGDMKKIVELLTHGRPIG